MTSEDDSSISEDEMDEIVGRVVDELADAGVGAAADEPDQREIEVHPGDDDGAFEDADDDGAYDPGGDDGDEAFDEADEAWDDVDPRGESADDEPGSTREDARRRAREAREEARDARHRAHERGAGFEDLGDRIEAAVEAQLDHVAETLEHSLGVEPPEPPEPTMPGVVIGPDDTREKAVYKTQLQKGGRVAVPDTEIEALGLEPGDTLQVVLYPVE